MKCRTQFWKGTTQGSFQQNLVEIGSVVSEEKIKKSSLMKLLSQSQPNFAEMILVWSSSKMCPAFSEHRPRWPPQEGGHPRTIPPKFGCNWPSGFWGEDFYVNFP
jgi:hypothetical protein